MEQKESRCILRSRLPIKDRQPVHACCEIMRSHLFCRFLCLGQAPNGCEQDDYKNGQVKA